MWQAHPVHSVSRSGLNLSPARVEIMQFAIIGVAVVALAVALSIFFPMSPNNNGWDAASYLAAFDH
jgi:hypothetical protein